MFDDLYHKQHVQIANNVAPSPHLTALYQAQRICVARLSSEVRCIVMEVFKWYNNCFVGLIITSSLSSFYAYFHSSQPLDHSKNTVLMRFSFAAAVLAVISTATASTSVDLSNAKTDFSYAKYIVDKLAKDDKSTLKPASLSLSTPRNIKPRID
jgi:hypothetical protein